jgi:hypothetical protein
VPELLPHSYTNYTTRSGAVVTKAYVAVDRWYPSSKTSGRGCRQVR